MFKKAMFILAAGFLFGAGTLPASAAGEVSWPNEATHTQDGANGFYYMYSDQYNTSEYDTTKFKSCVYDAKNAWAMWFPGTKTWHPPVEDVSKDYYTAKPYKNGIYATFDESGKIVPGCDKSMVLKYVAPADGNYTFKVKLELGSLLPVNEGWWEAEYGADPEYDGTGYAVYHNTKKLDSGYYDPDQPTWDQVQYKEMDIKSLKSAIAMKKGDAMYFITDQRANGTYDGSQWDIKVSYVATVATTATPKTDGTTSVVTKAPDSTTSAVGTETTDAAAKTTESGDTTTDTGDTTGVSTGTAALSTTTAGPVTEAGGGGDEGSNIGLIVGLVIGGVVVLGGGGAALYYFVLRKKLPGGGTGGE